MKNINHSSVFDILPRRQPTSTFKNTDHFLFWIIELTIFLGQLSVFSHRCWIKQWFFIQFLHFNHRLKKLMERLESFHLLMDSENGLKLLEACSIIPNKKWSVFLMVDVGYHRGNGSNTELWFIFFIFFKNIVYFQYIR